MTPTDHHHDASYEHNEDVAHEHSDINIRTVLMAAVVLMVVTGIAMAAMGGVFRLLNSQAAKNDPQVSPLAPAPGQVPPEPRLQTNEYAGLEQFRQRETQTLEGYGWVDQKTGVARVPIAEAKKLLLQRGLPVRQGTPVDPLLGTHAPAYGESSGGRTVGQFPAAAAAPQPPAGEPAAQPPAKPAPETHKGGGHE